MESSEHQSNKGEAGSQSISVPPDLPPGWITRFDEQAQAWRFAERATGETLWRPLAEVDGVPLQLQPAVLSSPARQNRPNVSNSYFRAVSPCGIERGLPNSEYIVGMTMDCDGKALKNKDMGARAPVAEGDITIQQPSNDGERLIADVAAPVFRSVGGVSFDDETEIDNVPIALRLVDELEGEEDEMFEALFPTPASGYGSQQPDGQQSSRTIARVIDALREDLGRLDWSRCGTPEF